MARGARELGGRVAAGVFFRGKCEKFATLLPGSRVFFSILKIVRSVRKSCPALSFFVFKSDSRNCERDENYNSLN
jgi:hypothetical protein